MSRETTRKPERFSQSSANYEDSADKANECKYQEASALLQNSDYDDAKALFSALGDYGDSADKVKFCDYKKAEKLLADVIMLRQKQF